ncbi:uncharacterized protein PV09_05809 [Verruconis gallopava]|uniref:Flavin reductase like domain-containing protein n=1 Tax=Verruconis gallopava TaxID=253628 RepID=A0A0D1YQ56_9PEZI|nr:uncharacterized protein PV09_05809 [Verruconis gallopava]KIW02737.1 hypothetical protein PV09_05809 [Verruconis gallopava]
MINNLQSQRALLNTELKYYDTMDKRKASHAFFLTFRSWNMVCLPQRCHSLLLYSHTLGSFRRMSKPYLRCRSASSHKRLLSSKCGDRPGTVVSTAELLDVKIRKALPPGNPYNCFDEALMKLHPKLEISAFLSILGNHMDDVIQKSIRKEYCDSDTFKLLMRSMPHPTVLVAALSDEHTKRDDSRQNSDSHLSTPTMHFRGAVISSMTSVCIGPPAILSFNFKEPSSTLAGIRANRFFTIHFLRANVHGAELARQFLRHLGDHDAAWRGVAGSHKTEVLKRVDWRAKTFYAPPVPMAPIIRGPGVASRLVCEILPEKCVSDVGDHSIIVAKVVSAPSVEKDLEDEQRSYDGFAPLLLYSQGEFREHGAILQAPEQGNQAHGSLEQVSTREQHESLDLGLNTIDSDDPILYRAAISYMDSVLDSYKDSEHYESLRAFHYKAMSSFDKRATFIGALKLWQFQQSMERGDDISNFHIRDIVSGSQDVLEALDEDPGLRAAAEELVRSATSKTGSPLVETGV